MTAEYKPKNRIEFLEMIDRVYERKYENVNINMKYDGLDVEYDLVETEPEDPKLIELPTDVCMGFEFQEINKKHQACFIPYPDF